MALKETIANLAQQALSDESQFLVDVIVSSKQGLGKVTVVLDGDHGITINDCASLSRRLMAAMEAAGLVGENFTMEVTTPGLDHPLKMKRQYHKNIGRAMKVQLKDKTVELGKLMEVTDREIALEQEIKEGKKKEIKRTALPFTEIEKAIVQVSFK